jgi:TolB-like protein/DNA-binding winged helix-turn-helix (wHTH) protein
MTVSVYKFGEFALDFGRFELTRNGQPIRLERKPMELLILLAERDGQLVSREEIAERLWKREVFVDIKHGINTAVRKIRQTLRDHPADPHFVQTVTGKGYRLIAPLSTIQQIEGPDFLLVARDTTACAVSPAPASRGASRDCMSFASANQLHRKSEDREASNNGARTTSDFPSGVLIKEIAATAQRTSSQAWRGVALTVLGAMLGCAIALAARGWARPERNPPRINSLAVLPLENLSKDAGQDYLADGVTDELITMLARDSTLQVVSRTSVMQYKRVHRPLREIARPLGADAILEGSIARSGDEVHINLQLIAAYSDTHLWAESYDRNLRDLPALPLEAARAIAYRLHRTLVGMPDYAVTWAEFPSGRISCPATLDTATCPVPPAPASRGASRDRIEFANTINTNPRSGSRPGLICSPPAR